MSFKIINDQLIIKDEKSSIVKIDTKNIDHENLNIFLTNITDGDYFLIKITKSMSSTDIYFGLEANVLIIKYIIPCVGTVKLYFNVTEHIFDVLFKLVGKISNEIQPKNTQRQQCINLNNI
jgi:hypothetical protein